MHDYIHTKQTTVTYLINLQIFIFQNLSVKSFDTARISAKVKFDRNSY